MNDFVPMIYIGCKGPPNLRPSRISANISSPIARLYILTDDLNKFNKEYMAVRSQQDKFQQWVNQRVTAVKSNIAVSVRLHEPSSGTNAEHAVRRTVRCGAQASRHRRRPQASSHSRRALQPVRCSAPHAKSAHIFTESLLRSRSQRSRTSSSTLRVRWKSTRSSTRRSPLRTIVSPYASCSFKRKN